MRWGGVGARLLQGPSGITDRRAGCALVGWLGSRVGIGHSPGDPAHLIGDILGETVLGSLTPSETQKLLTLPKGCPEQTLSSLTPVVILAQYLDATGQWGKVGVEHREKVMKNVVSGYTRMLTHRSSDGTYHTSKGSPGSTW